jgi:hypothetical protein
MSARSVLFLVFPWIALAVVVVFAFAQLRARQAAAAALEVAAQAGAESSRLLAEAPDEVPDEVPRVVGPVEAPAEKAPRPDWRARAERQGALRAVAEARARALAAERDALTARVAALEARRSSPPEGAAVAWRTHAGRPETAAARRAAEGAGADDLAALAALVMDTPDAAGGVTRLLAHVAPSAGADALVVDVVSRAPNAPTAVARLDRLGIDHVLRPAVLAALLAAREDHVRDAIDAWIAARAGAWGRLERERVEAARAVARDGR